MDAGAGIAFLAVIVALGTAVVSWSRANRADQRADETERRADRALQLAESAEARASRLERIATESRNVAWEERPTKQLGSVSFRHIGADRAHDVELLLFKADTNEVHRERFAAVDPGDPVGANLTTWASEAKERAEAHNRRFENSDSVFITSVPAVHVRARLTWRSASGIPDTQEFNRLAV